MRQAQLADLRDNDPDRAAAVDGGHMSLQDALRLRADDLAKERRREESRVAAIRRYVADMNLAFAGLSMLKHDQHRQNLLANWTPTSEHWTAASLHELADLLHDLANDWKH